MQTSFTKDQLREHLYKLPQPLQDVFLSLDTAEAVQNIGKANGLHLNEMGVLGELVGAVMLGMTSPEEFTRDVAREFQRDEKTTANIVTVVNEKIFLPIRELLKAQTAQTFQENSKEQNPSEEEKSLERGKLLAEIENPEKLLPAPPQQAATSTTPPIPAAAPEKKPDIPHIPSASPEATSQVAITPPTTSAPASTPSSPYATIFEQKLREPTRVLRQEVKFSTPRGSIDPYREPPE